MEALRAVATVPGSFRVGERQAGGQKQADAFRRAMQQQGDGDPAGAGSEAAATAEQPMRTGLQPRGGDGRKDQHPTRHVDVIA